MNQGGFSKLAMGLVIGAIIGFVVGFAVNYEDAESGAAAPVKVAKSNLKPVDTKPMRDMVAPPAKGGQAPKVIIEEVSEFQ